PGGHLQPTEKEEFFTGQEQDAGYAHAFRDYGIDLAELPVGQAATRIQARSIRRELTRALDFWSSMRRRAGNPGPPDWKLLVDVARASDHDAWRNQLRAALQRDDRKALEILMAASGDLHQLPRGTLHLLGTALNDFGLPKQAVALLRKAQRQYPGDLWINGELGWFCLTALRPPQYDESARFYTAALAVR